MKGERGRNILLGVNIVIGNHKKGKKMTFLWGRKEFNSYYAVYAKFQRFLQINENVEINKQLIVLTSAGKVLH